MASYGLLAEFAGPDELIEAARRVRASGYSSVDACSPFAIRELETVLQSRTGSIPVVATTGALVGAALTYATQYFTNALEYPLNVGGRPLDSWPAFIPATIIVAVLWSAVATLVWMLVKCGLPRLHHPLFDVPEFDRATDDGFFLVVEARDPLYDVEQIRTLLNELNPSAVIEIGR